MDLYRLLSLFSVQPQASGGAPVVALPSGIIADFGGTVAPTGWLLCDGAAVSRTTYAALFTAIGTAFGVGDGSTTFNVPDCRGRSGVGTGAGGGLTNRVLAATGGEETHVLSIPEMPSHTHHWGASAMTGSLSISSQIVAGTTDNLTDATGGGGAHNTMHPFIVLTKIISQ